MTDTVLAIGKNVYATLIPRGNKKTDSWTIRSAHTHEPIGSVRWYAQWRRYVFYPARETLFDFDCLREITSFVCERMIDYRAAKLLGNEVPPEPEDDGSWPQPGDMPNMAGGHEHWDDQ